MAAQPHFVYVLRDPETHAVRYVGQTRSPSLRRSNHRTRNMSANGPLREWIASLHALGMQPAFEVVAEFRNEDIVAGNGHWLRSDVLARRTEAMLIELCRNNGCNLLNADMDDVRRRAKATNAKHRTKFITIELD